MSDTNALADQLEALAAKATSGNLATAERHTESEFVECPFCQGDGEVEAADYCNFDGKALGVQFYGIGDEFGAHEKLWRKLIDNLPAIIAVLRAEQALAERDAEVARYLHALRNILTPSMQRDPEYAGMTLGDIAQDALGYRSATDAE